MPVSQDILLRDFVTQVRGATQYPRKFCHPLANTVASQNISSEAFQRLNNVPTLYLPDNKGVDAGEILLFNQY